MALSLFSPVIFFFLCISFFTPVISFSCSISFYLTSQSFFFSKINSFPFTFLSFSVFLFSTFFLSFTFSLHCSLLSSFQFYWGLFFVKRSSWRKKIWNWKIFSSHFEIKFLRTFNHRVKLTPRLFHSLTKICSRIFY